MAEAIRPGGVYQVGERFVNANGEPVDPPARKETAEQRKADQEAEQQLQEAAAREQEQLRRAEPQVEPQAARRR